MNGVTVTIKVTDRHLGGDKVSVQNTHLQLYIDGKLDAIELRDFDDNLLKVYRDAEIGRLLGSAVMRGRRVAQNGDFYYLGDR